MTELADLDIADAITTEQMSEQVRHTAREFGAPRPRLTARWEIDAESGHPVCRWSAEG